MQEVRYVVEFEFPQPSPNQSQLGQHMVDLLELHFVSDLS